MYALRGLLKIQTKRRLVITLEHLYHYESMAARFYRTMAFHTLDVNQRNFFLDRANLFDRKARHCALRMSLLRPAHLPGDENWLDRVWYGMLLCRAPNEAIHWLEWMDDRENKELDFVVDAQRFWQ